MVAYGNVADDDENIIRSLEILHPELISSQFYSKFVVLKDHNIRSTKIY